ncbi:MAG: hypothetical protein ACLT63_00515 [Bacteroides xylanisolvens]
MAQKLQTFTMYIMDVVAPSTLPSKIEKKRKKKKNLINRCSQGPIDISRQMR